MSRAAITIILLSAALGVSLGGCRTHRAVAEKTDSRTVTRTDTDSTAKTRTVREGTRLFSFVCDSLGIVFTADSIVTGEGTIHRPRVGVGAARPRLAKAETVRDSTEEAVAVVRGSETEATLREDRAETARAQALSPLAALGAMIPALLVALALAAWLKGRGKGGGDKCSGQPP